MPSPVALIALIESVPEQPCIDPQWLEQLLQSNWPAYAAVHPRLETQASPLDDQLPSPRATRPRDASEAWAVATVTGNETLVQSRPRVRGGNVGFLDDLLRPRTRCTLGGYSSSLGGRPTAIPVPRYHRWVGLVAAPQDDAHTRAAKDLCASLPSFLARARGQAEDGTALFFAFLGQLHRAGALGQVYPQPAQVRAALNELRTELRQRIGPSAAANLMVTDGRCFAMLHESGAVARAIAGGPKPRPRSGPVLVGRHTPAAVVMLLTEPNAATEPTADALSAPAVFSVDVDTPTQLSLFQLPVS